MTSKHLDPLLDISQEPFKVADVDAVADADAMRGPPTEPPGGGGGGGGKPPDSPGGGGGGGGKPDGAGSKKGDLYGDQWVLLRDLDPTDEDGEGNGDPVLDTNDNPILVGWDGSEEFPIFLTDDDGDGKYEVPADQLDYVQEVELERANVARAPDKVMDKALQAALDKIDGEVEIDTDPAGRIMYSIDEGYMTIDLPLENLALYQHLMTLGSTGDQAGSWGQGLIDLWEKENDGCEKIVALVGDDPQNPDWDPSSLLGAAFSKETPISFDAVLYENTTLGVNVVQDDGSVDYFDFNEVNDEVVEETYNYDRQARYEEIELKWIEVRRHDGARSVRISVDSSTMWYSRASPGATGRRVSGAERRRDRIRVGASACNAVGRERFRPGCR